MTDGRSDGEKEMDKQTWGKEKEEEETTEIDSPGTEGINSPLLPTQRIRNQGFIIPTTPVLEHIDYDYRLGEDTPFARERERETRRKLFAQASEAHTHSFHELDIKLDSLDVHIRTK